MLTSLTPSASMACSAVDTFSRWWCWFAGLGFHRGKRRCVSTSTSAQSRVPSRKSSAKSTTGPPPISPACFKCSFTQFLKVFAWISTQRSSWPFIGIPFAAVPSADLATRPTNCSGRSCSVDCILLPFFLCCVPDKFEKKMKLFHNSISLAPVIIIIIIINIIIIIIAIE